MDELGGFRLGSKQTLELCWIDSGTRGEIWSSFSEDIPAGSGRVKPKVFSDLVAWVVVCCVRLLRMRWALAMRCRWTELEVSPRREGVERGLSFAFVCVFLLLGDLFDMMRYDAMRCAAGGLLIVKVVEAPVSSLGDLGGCCLSHPVLVLVGGGTFSLPRFKKRNRLGDFPTG